MASQTPIYQYFNRLPKQDHTTTNCRLLRKRKDTAVLSEAKQPAKKRHVGNKENDSSTTTRKSSAKHQISQGRLDVRIIPTPPQSCKRPIIDLTGSSYQTESPSIIHHALIPNMKPSGQVFLPTPPPTLPTARQSNSAVVLSPSSPIVIKCRINERHTLSETGNKSTDTGPSTPVRKGGYLRSTSEVPEASEGYSSPLKPGGRVLISHNLDTKFRVPTLPSTNEQRMMSVDAVPSSQSQDTEIAAFFRNTNLATCRERSASVVPSSQANEEILNDPHCFWKKIDKVVAPDIVPTSQTQTEFELCLYSTIFDDDTTVINSPSPHGLTQILKENHTTKMPSQNCSQTQVDSQYDALTFGHASQCTSFTESDPGYDELIFGTITGISPMSSPSLRSLSGTEESWSYAYERFDREDGVNIPGEVTLFCDMFGVGEGSYPPDFPESLQ